MITLLDAGDDIDPALVAITLEGSIQKTFGNQSCQARSDDTRAHAEHIGVVVPFREDGRERLADSRCSDARKFIGSNGHTDTCATDKNATVELTPNMAGPAFDALDGWLNAGTQPPKAIITESKLYTQADNPQAEYEARKDLGY